MINHSDLEPVSVTIIYGKEWQVIYVDGKLAYQTPNSNPINALSAISAVQNELVGSIYFLSREDYEDYFPRLLKDLKKNKKIYGQG